MVVNRHRIRADQLCLPKAYNFTAVSARRWSRLFVPRATSFPRTVNRLHLGVRASSIGMTGHRTTGFQPHFSYRLEFVDGGRVPLALQTLHTGRPRGDTGRAGYRPPYRSLHDDEILIVTALTGRGGRGAVTRRSKEPHPRNMDWLRHSTAAPAPPLRKQTAERESREELSPSSPPSHHRTLFASDRQSVSGVRLR